MSMRWKVRGLPLAEFNKDGGSVGEPFAAIQVGTGKKPTTIVLTKENVFYEGDEERSTIHEGNRQHGT